MIAAIQATDLPLAGAYLLTPRAPHDERGTFVRSWSASTLVELGIDVAWTYGAYAHNTRRGTLRGLHYQSEPHTEQKLVSCVRGSVWDVLLDLRSESTTYGQWHGEMLSGASLTTLYVPGGVAHGYISLEDDSLVSYQISGTYVPGASAGVRWDDPVFAIDWPVRPSVISERDRSFALHRAGRTG